MKFNELPRHIQDRVRRDNPDIFRPLETSKSKPIPSQALARIPSNNKRRVGGEYICVTLIACRKRCVDDDNNVASLKPLRDAIACNLSIDDGDKRIRWEYGQTETRNSEGVVVKMETCH